MIRKLKRSIRKLLVKLIKKISEEEIFLYEIKKKQNKKKKTKQ